jgi:hypothetical protein
MFYTILSRIPQISTHTSERKYLIIFILGSIVYTVLHYYLYSHTDFLNNVKKYLYYVMGIDFAIAYCLTKYYSTSNEPETDDGSYSDEQRQLIMSRLNEIKRLHTPQSLEASQLQEAQKESQLREALQAQQAQQATQSEVSQKEPQQQSKQSEEDKQSKSPFMSKDEVEESKKAKKKKSKSSKKEKREKIVEDTDIPIYSKDGE